MTNLKVNFENNVGKIKPMNAVNNGPKTPGRSQYRDNFETYKALHLPFARTHDASICYDYGAEHCVDVKVFSRISTQTRPTPKTMISYLPINICRLS